MAKRLGSQHALHVRFGVDVCRHRHAPHQHRAHGEHHQRRQRQVAEAGPPPEVLDQPLCNGNQQRCPEGRPRGHDPLRDRTQPHERGGRCCHQRRHEQTRAEAAAEAVEDVALPNCRGSRRQREPAEEQHGACDQQRARPHPMQQRARQDAGAEEQECGDADHQRRRAVAGAELRGHGRHERAKGVDRAKCHASGKRRADRDPPGARRILILGGIFNAGEAVGSTTAVACGCRPVDGTVGLHSDSAVHGPNGFAVHNEANSGRNYRSRPHVHSAPAYGLRLPRALCGSRRRQSPSAALRCSRRQEPPRWRGASRC